MAGEGAALHLGPGGLRAASIAARLPKAYIATRAASIANVGLTLPVGGGWMQPHCGASSNTIAGQLQLEQEARHPARFASRRPTWWDGVPRYATY